MGKDKHWYRLNMDAYEWEDTGEALISGNAFEPFLGKYVVKGNGIYNRVTGEEVFKCNDVYLPALGGLSYFGGDKYLGKNGNEYRWVNLTDLSMSDPLPFPDVHESYLTILDDTYCVYEDQYGWFLWNYNTGEEETIMLFDN